MSCCHETMMWVGIAVEPYDADQVRAEAERRLRERAAARRRDLVGAVTVVIETGELADRHAAAVIAVAPSAPAVPVQVRPSGPGMWVEGEVAPL